MIEDKVFIYAAAIIVFLVVFSGCTVRVTCKCTEQPPKVLVQDSTGVYVEIEPQGE